MSLSNFCLNKQLVKPILMSQNSFFIEIVINLNYTLIYSN